MIEAAIVGKAVLTVQAPEFAGTQEGTLHFHYLMPENGGFVDVARSSQEHAAQLARVLADPAGVAERTQRFVATFVRPFGREQAATPLVADAIEGLRATAPLKGSTLLRLALAPLALLVAAIDPRGRRSLTWRSPGALLRPFARSR